MSKKIIILLLFILSFLFVFAGELYDSETNIDDEMLYNLELPVNQFIVYPNPVSNGKVFFKFSLKESISNMKILFYNFNGVLIEELSVVKKRKLEKNKYFFPIELSKKNFPPGLYIIRIEADGQIFTKKLVVS